MMTAYNGSMATEFAELGPIRFPRSYTKGRKSGQPTVIFIHTTEGSERPTSAEDGAAYCQTRTDDTSAHFFTDQNSIVQGVPTDDEAHTARAHGNDVGIHIEVCGKAGQTPAQWADTASAGTIRQTARLCVMLRKKYPGRFPLVNLTPAQLRAGKKGFAEHYDATKAWPEDKGSHTDPGPNFPWKQLFTLITEAEKGKVMPEANPRTWTNPTVLALNFFYAEAYRASQGKATGTDKADKNARNALAYLRGVAPPAPKPPVT